MSTVLDQFAESVVAETIGVPVAALRDGIVTGKPIAGFDIVGVMAIIQALMAAFSGIMKDCPQSNSDLRESIKSPTRWQQAQAIHTVREYTGDCFGLFWRRKAARLAQEMLKQAAGAEDDTIDKAIAQVRGIEN